LDARAAPIERAMDSNEIERERGITILSKTTAISWRNYRINIVDTPGHADFGGEVERVLSMVDSVLLLVDAVEGPMPQTRFVTQKAFAQGLNPIVVINKIDRDGARPDWVLNETFDLFDKLDASDEQLDFPVVYASALYGFAGLDPKSMGEDMTALLEAIVEHVPPPQVDRDGPFQMQVSSLDYSSYVGAIAIGRIERGSVRTNTPVTVVSRTGTTRSARVLQVLRSEGLERIETESASAGDIVAVTGVEAPNISDTLCDPACPEALPPLTVDEPTVSMDFLVNTSPLAGRDGKFLTSRQIRERLMRELIHNVALRVDETGDADRFLVSGRGELHLAILIENMRREGYELAISRPRVILKDIDGQLCEPFEQLIVDVEERNKGRSWSCWAHGAVRSATCAPTAAVACAWTIRFLRAASSVFAPIFSPAPPAPGLSTITSLTTDRAARETSPNEVTAPWCRTRPARVLASRCLICRNVASSPSAPARTSMKV
jgi:GTP-binding protein